MDNRDHIKELFGRDGIKAPESLSEENMLKMLEAADNASAREAAQADAKAAGNIAAGTDKGRKRFAPAGAAVRTAIAAAAALLICVFGISGLADTLLGPPDTSETSGGLYTFRSEGEIRRTLMQLEKSSSSGILRIGQSVENEEYTTGLISEDTTMDAESSDAAEIRSDAASLSAQKSESHSSTYLQVDDVDEADIVKTDGKYIYYVNDREEVVILSAKDGKTERVASIGSSGVENYVSDIYLKGDTLITVGRFYRGDEEGTSGIVIYDISDRSHPQYVRDFSQSGDILSSRMVGEVVYLVTNYRVYRGGRVLPVCGSGEKPGQLSPSDVCCLPEPQDPSYIVLSAVDTASGSQGRAVTKAVFGSTDTIYCNDRNLYTASLEYDKDTGGYYTRIARAGLNGTDVSFDATARVRGSVLSQFAMDEKDGCFRIATTSDRAGMDVNNLFVLDRDMKQTGEVTGFARNESIKAVRYIGDKAYVITYQAIDPLFIIDLADPKDPRIEGEVMIDGFSTLLVPLGSGKLLGIGHATGDNGYGGEFDSGLKLALFDISDPSRPAVLDSREFEDMTSPAQSDHHALTVNTEDGWLAVPYDIYDQGGSEVIIEDGIAESEEPSDDVEVYMPEEPDNSHEAGMLVFSADDKISRADKHALGSTSFSRSVYIGDYIYAISRSGTVQSFRP